MELHLDNWDPRKEPKNVIVQPFVESDPGAKPCDSHMECVEIWMCRNKTTDGNEAYTINLPSNYHPDACNYNQVCCNIDDKLLTKPSFEPMLNMRDCGYRNEKGVQLSIDGIQHNEAQFGEFPWMTAILVRDDPLLLSIGGGSLIAPNVVLTAAHKVSNREAPTLIVRAGEWDQQTMQEIYDHQDIAVKRKILHNDFNGYINNIALLLLKESFMPSPHIAPICLPDANTVSDNARCFVTGWGKIPLNSNEYARILKKVTVPVLPHNRCIVKLRNALGANFNLDRSNMCAGGEKGVDSCAGDGGAPLVCPIQGKPNRYYQAGIVSWGIKCGLEDIPAAYTNVAYLLPWIIGELDQLRIDRNFYTA
ncbi:GH21265 [Drosophila grimshawi]|uniref:Phenoloxidase-activating factor 2 n=1 Tax=Drosophila grimshawi TaxID=7222 RepID=B4J7S7_DROGR|nr:GH21265 [Drosophila grimshawi]